MNEELIDFIKSSNGHWTFKTESGKEVSKEQIIKALEQQPSEDCISRESVLRLVEQYPNIIGNRCVGLMADIKHLPSVTPQQTSWIPCSERLPERDVNVLTYHRNVSFDYQYVSWIDDYSGKWAGFIGNLSDEVLAWMPLPEPYKAESEDKV